MARSREQAAERIEQLLRSIMRGLRGRKREPGHGHDLDITLGQLHCLRQVSDLGQPTMGDLAERLRLSPSTVTGLVDGLVSRGLVERREDAEDRRIVRVALTGPGRRHRDQRRGLQQQRLARVFAALSDEDLEWVGSALERLSEVVAEAAEPGEAGACGEDS